MGTESLEDLEAERILLVDRRLDLLTEATHAINRRFEALAVAVLEHDESVRRLAHNQVAIAKMMPGQRLLNGPEWREVDPLQRVLSGFDDGDGALGTPKQGT